LKQEHNLPTHIGFIMDGNRRWAREKGLPELEGHRRGLYDALIPILKACREREIKYITIWAFSTENWKRSKKEIGYLMKLFEALFRDKLAEMKKEGVKINVIGRLTDFPERIQQLAKG
jgi:undecaprenyl diphosphate synthase